MFAWWCLTIFGLTFGSDVVGQQGGEIRVLAADSGRNPSFIQRFDRPITAFKLTLVEDRWVL